MDSFNEALVVCIKALGGSKQVGPLLWPEKDPIAAQRLLLDCMSDDRPAHLTPDQAVLVLKMAHNKGVHTGMEFLADRLGYAPPVAIEPQDEAAELQRDFVAATEMMAQLVGKMERLQGLQAQTRALRAA